MYKIVFVLFKANITLVTFIFTNINKIAKAKSEFIEGARLRTRSNFMEELSGKEEWREE